MAVLGRSRSGPPPPPRSNPGSAPGQYQHNIVMYIDTMLYLILLVIISLAIGKRCLDVQLISQSVKSIKSG